MLSDHDSGGLFGLNPPRNTPNIQAVVQYFQSLQDFCCEQMQSMEHETRFREDKWDHHGGGGGITRVIENGEVFEKGGINFSLIEGVALPETASATRRSIAGRPFKATGVSLVMHPRNPFVPTTHMNVRFFVSDPESEHPVWWFGGGYDLTPCYGFVEDCVHWHQTAKRVCDAFDPLYYPKFKEQCDEYFFIPHRNEARGVGGLFFDDLNEPGFEKSFEFIRAVGSSLPDAYLPIVVARKETGYTDRHRRYQSYRRGRYVEFNLVYDRGTVFGLQSRGRTESILMSLPPVVNWVYNWSPAPGSEEETLQTDFLKPRNWLENET